MNRAARRNGGGGGGGGGEGKCMKCDDCREEKATCSLVSV